jgi:hypothetical protein
MYNSCGTNSFHKKHGMHKMISTETKYIWESKDTFTNQD